ncbi:hypothetical protein Dda_5673 [Drechslerella dactyloides]|uniref:Uncharacterized protein n=1 Tax=Drechslerella dactyloides TaxID=74499 RepID=A0AAD6IWJ0_DREDA|nr:hypothetical protein Dda_5673 [Drechslerella dactyloides]
MLRASTSLLSLYLATYGVLAAPQGNRLQNPLTDVAKLLVDINLDSAMICGDEISAPISAIALPKVLSANSRDSRSGIIRVQIDPTTLKAAKTDELCNGAFSNGVPEDGSLLKNAESVVVVFKKTGSGLWGLKCDRPIVRSKSSGDGTDVEKRSSDKTNGDDIKSLVDIMTDVSTKHDWAAPPSYPDVAGSENTLMAPSDAKEDISDVEVTTDIPNVSGYSTYTVEFAKRSFHMDYLIKDATDAPILYVNNKHLVAKLRGGKPDVIIHAGADDQGPIVFASRSSILGTSHEICFGDPATSDKYAELHLKHAFSLTATWSPPGSDKKYTFKRVYGKEAQSLGGRKASLLTLKLTDDETGEIVATYLNDGAKTWRKAGTYQIKANPEFGEDWEKYVVFVGCVLTEKERRARRWAAASGGGGGG